MNAIVTAVREQLCGFYEDSDPAEAQLTFLGATPMTLLRFGPDSEGVVTYASLGCSAEPMADPNDMTPDFTTGPRAEIIVEMNNGLDEIIRPLAMLAASPSIEGLVLQEDALLDFNSPLWAGSRFTGFVLIHADVPDVTAPGGETVTMLQAVPATANEFALARAKGVPELRQTWESHGTVFADPHRVSVV
ncbi:MULTISPECIES: suppressor of fused domain protein [unclassified Corynebacterium]|uniref:suppressor of fused domain protein n=1 Tax=unclassified Corynebacterium TaxID=2624378 RepID=UPI0030A31CF1